MRDHIKILGILNMILGGLGLVAAIGIFVLFGGLAGLAGLAGFNNTGSNGPPDGNILVAIGFFLALVIAVIGLPQLLGGWGLIHYKPGARILMIVVSALSLLDIPIGTAVGSYGLWALLNDETNCLFAKDGQTTVPHEAGYPIGPEN